LKAFYPPAYFLVEMMQGGQRKTRRGAAGRNYFYITILRHELFIITILWPFPAADNLKI
jgi:hypothetical protein